MAQDMSMIEKLDMVERVGELVLKSYKPTEIARALEITPAQAKFYIEQHREIVRKRVEEDPDFLERLAENTFEALERLDNLVKEAWETYDTAKANDLIAQQTNLLKVAGTFEQQRANLLQLMGAKMDSGAMARMQKAERVNEIVTRIIKDVVADCPNCSTQVMPRLAEAFALMNKQEEAADMQPVSEEPDFIEGEVEEDEEEVDRSGMLTDVVAYE